MFFTKISNLLWVLLPLIMHTASQKLSGNVTETPNEQLTPGSLNPLINSSVINNPAEEKNLTNRSPVQIRNFPGLMKDRKITKSLNCLAQQILADIPDKHSALIDDFFLAWFTMCRAERKITCLNKGVNVPQNESDSVFRELDASSANYRNASQKRSRSPDSVEQYLNDLVKNQTLQLDEIDSAYLAAVRAHEKAFYMPNGAPGKVEAHYESYQVSHYYLDLIDARKLEKLNFKNETTV